LGRAEGETRQMGLLDLIVGKSFRDGEAGRVAVFAGDRGTRGHVVKSGAEERKIRSFLKMFYFAQLSIQLLGLLLAYEWSKELSYALGRPGLHVFRSAAVFAVTYSVTVLLPSLLLWRTYRKELLAFVSAQDEVVLVGNPARRQPWIAIVGMGALMLGVLTLLVVMAYLVRTR